jgi:AcrR family transcriptional regulator
MRWLAAETGMTAMAVYRYFPDKQAVLDAATGLINEEFLVERGKQAAAAEPNVPGWLDLLISSVVSVLVRHHRDITVLAQAQVSGSSGALPPDQPGRVQYWRSRAGVTRTTTSPPTHSFGRSGSP